MGVGTVGTAGPQLPSPPFGHRAPPSPLPPLLSPALITKSVTRVKSEQNLLGDAGPAEEERD